MGRAKLTRALMRGGVAERRADGAYEVWRSRNRSRRSLGVIPRRAGDALRADGKIALLAGEPALYGWSGSDAFQPKPPLLPAPAITSAVRTRRVKRDLLTRALDGAVDSRERTRLSDAARRFIADSEQALAAPGMSANWTMLQRGRVDGGPMPAANLPGYAGVRARRRLQVVEQEMGRGAVQILAWALVTEMSARELGRRLCCRAEMAAKHVTDALRTLAMVYDQKLKGMA